MKKKNHMSKAKRIPKSKDELKATMEKDQRIARQRKLVRELWPLIEKLDTIYDAQTAFNAASGYIKYELSIQMSKVSVKDLKISLKDEKASDIKDSVFNILELLSFESASDVADLLEAVGNKIGQFGAYQYLKNPMTDLKLDDFVA